MSAPALPALGVMQLWLHVGWALVVAGGVTAVLARLTTRFTARVAVLRAVAAALAVWTMLPGPYSSAYWLGLAFQAPSGVLALVCGLLGWRALRTTKGQAPAGEPAGVLGLACVGVLGGWVLLMDAFAQWPWAVYGWGFGRAALAALTVMALLPLLQKDAYRRATAWLMPGALLLFAALRLPTGNVWDAVLDPWLWVFLHGVVLRAAYRRWRH